MLTERSIFDAQAGDSAGTLATLEPLEAWQRQDRSIGRLLAGVWSSEPILVAWIKWKQSFAAVAPVQSSQVTIRLAAVINQLDQALGLAGSVFVAPLLWKHGGHPLVPPSLALAEEEVLLRDLAARLCVTARGFVPLEEPQQLHQRAHAISVGVLDPSLQAKALDVIEDKSKAAAAVAASDPRSRRLLLECLTVMGLMAHQRVTGSSSSLEELEQTARAMVKAARGRITDISEELLGPDSSWLQERLDVLPAAPEHDLPPLQVPMAQLSSAKARASQLLLAPLSALGSARDLAAVLSGLVPAVVRGARAPRQVLIRAKALLDRCLEREPSSLLLLAPLQQLLWAQEMGSSPAASELGMSILHELVFAFHESRWLGGLALILAKAPADWALVGPSCRPHHASGLALAASLLESSSSTVHDKDLRLQELRIGARLVRLEEARTQSGQSTAVAEAHIALSSLLLLFVCHVPSLASDEAKAAAHSLLESAGRALSTSANLDASLVPALAAAFQSSSHSVFGSLLGPVLIPALEAAVTCIQAASIPMDMLGRCWALLGLSRLHLSKPPTGIDPSGKYALLRSMLRRRLEEEVLPEISARRQWMRMPGVRSQRARVSELEAEADALEQRLRELDSKAVPRPEPGQYLDLQESCTRFLDSVAEISKALALLAALGSRDAAAAERARVVVDTIGTWVERTGRSYSLYRDVLQPLALGCYELRHGLALLAAGVLVPTFAPQPGSADSLLCGAAATLVTYPNAAASEGGAEPLWAPAVQMAIGQAAASSLGTAEVPEDPLKSRARREAASYSARVEALHCALSSLGRATELAADPRPLLEELEGLLGAFVRLWEELKEVEARRAAEEAEQFKTKTQTTAIDNVEQAEERSFQERFPSYFEAFADLGEGLDLGPTGGEGEDASPAEATEAEAGTAIAKELLGGSILRDLVGIHRRVFERVLRSERPGVSPAGGDLLASYAKSYALGLSLLRSHGLIGPAVLDRLSSAGSLARLAWEARQHKPALEGAAASSDAGPQSLDVFAPCLEEAVLANEPVGALRDRLRDLLAEWPENPLLTQLLMIADRLLAMPASAPFKQIITGTGLLLARAQVWEETAAKHVSLREQLDRIAALATRWHRLELASWGTVLDRTVQRHAEGAHRSWFHVYRLVMRPAADLSLEEVAQTLEHFVQTATLGEFRERLALIATFEGHVAARLSGMEASGANYETACKLLAILHNVHSYYGQFAPAVAAQVESMLGPLRKDLADFVKLAKWEDRGFYALRTQAEKAHRQLHRLATRAEEFLREPAAGVVATASREMGFSDLVKAKETGELAIGIEPASAPKAKRKGSKTKKDAEVAVDHDALLRQLVAESKGTLVPVPAAADGQHLPRLQQLSDRLRKVVFSSLTGDMGTHLRLGGSSCLEELSTDLIETSLELRAVTDKSAKLRKKKALVDLFKYLEQLGLSRRKTAVPASERTVQSWFQQSPPRSLQAALTGPTGPEADALWKRADAYYFLSLARIQRLWEAAKAPSRDISAVEVERACRFSEHILFLQRCQRRQLDLAAEAISRLGRIRLTIDALGQEEFGLARQSAARAWSEDQSRRLASLQALLEEALAAAHAAADLESATNLRTSLRAGAATYQSVLSSILRCRQRINPDPTALVPASEVAALAENAAALREALGSLQAHLPNTADKEDWMAHVVPCCATLTSALTEATMADARHHASVGGLLRAGADVDLPKQAVEVLDGSVGRLLLWAQDLKRIRDLVEERRRKQTEDLVPPADAADVLEEGAQEPLVSAEVEGTLPEWAGDLELAIGSSRLGEISSSLEAALSLLSAATEDPGASWCAAAAQVAGRVSALLDPIAQSCQLLLRDYLALHKATCKFGYILTNLLSGVVQEGFCTPPESQEGEGDGGKGDGKFQECEGTGLGEGQGRKDVSEQIENEDQVLGADFKDKQKQPEPQPPQPEAGEEETKGVEMEQDFEGELHNLSSDEEHEDDQDEEEDKDAERLDQQMGDLGDQEDIVDEKLWDGDDEEPEDGGKDKGPERYEKDKPIQVEDTKDLEYRAQDDDDMPEEPPNKQQQPKKEKGGPQDRQQNPHEEEEGDEQGDGLVHEEEQEQENFAKPEAAEPEMELPQDLNLDQGEDDQPPGGEEGPGDEDEAVERREDPEGPQEEDGPEEERPAPPDGDGREEADQVDDEGGDEGDAGQENPLAQALPEEEQEAAADPEAQQPPEAEEDPALKTAEPAGQEGDQPEQEDQQLAGPRGLPSAAPVQPTEEDKRAQAQSQGLQPQTGQDNDQGADAGGDDDQGAMPLNPLAEAMEMDQANDSRQVQAGAAATASQRGAKAPAQLTQPGQQGEQQQQQQQPTEETNPYRNLGKALDRWKANLRVTGDSQKKEEEEDKAGKDAPQKAPQDQDDMDVDPPAGAEFEFTGQGEAGDFQALAPATEDQAKEMEGLDLQDQADPEENEADETRDQQVAAKAEEPEQEEQHDQPIKPMAGKAPEKWKATNRKAGMGQEAPDDQLMGDEDADQADAAGGQGPVDADKEADGSRPEASVALQLMQDLELQGDQGDGAWAGKLTEEGRQQLRLELQERLRASQTEVDPEAGRAIWSRCEALTAPLASELVEQLRLLLEPTLASRMAGDYRSGKRINMKKVIAYIASHFRKDKIWMRRTRPDKRRYQARASAIDFAAR